MKRNRGAFTAEDLRALLDYDALTGQFTWRAGRAGTAWAGSWAGSVDSRGYVRIGIFGGIYKAHRLAWLHVHGHWPKHEIDHINGIKDDNRLENLRDVNGVVNKQNTREARGGRVAGLLGATYHEATGKWRARVWIGGRNKSLGLFDTAEEAHAVYIEAKREVHEGCTL